ncbi:glycosyltransferase family 2 protein [Mycobacterium sp.]|uniref:glycosyltransferase n=1 Tax=Mycobacterium sp. TaxID=1785 RepID=UPI0031D671D8
MTTSSYAIAVGNDAYLLHPELLELVPFGSSLTAKLLQNRIGETLVDDPATDSNITVVVRVFNEASALEKLFEDIDKQVYSGAIEVVVVDNGSSDRSPAIAKDYGAEVVTLDQSKFTYPRSLNLGMAAASNDLVFVTVAHVRLSSTHSLHAGARHFTINKSTAGAFGTCFPNDGASYFERWGAATKPNLFLGRPAGRVEKAGLGVLGATGAMIAKSAWQELGGFDERYQAGGEDTALAKLMLENGYGVVREPALTVHHSHGLDLADSFKQYVHQLQIVRGPRQFDRLGLLSRRPDLRANRSAS